MADSSLVVFKASDKAEQHGAMAAEHVVLKAKISGDLGDRNIGLLHQAHSVLLVLRRVPSSMRHGISF